MKRPSTSVLTSDKLAKSSKLSDEMLSFTGNAKQEVCVVCVESPENEKDLANEQSQSQGLSFEEIINKEQHIQEINIQEQQQQNNGVSNNPVHVVVEQYDDMSTVKNENFLENQYNMAPAVLSDSESQQSQQQQQRQTSTATVAAP